VESEIEFFEMDLAEPVRRPTEVVDELNRQLPDFMTVTSLTPAKKKAPVSEIISYDCLLPEYFDQNQAADSIAAFQSAENVSVERTRKGKTRHFDLKKFVRSLNLDNAGKLRLDLLHPHSEAGIGPREVIEKIFYLDKEQKQLAQIVKTYSKALLPG
jgi:hypothetical protein